MIAQQKYSSTLLAFFVFATLSLRLYLIWRHGSYLPFWDQWDAEADLLYKQMLLDGYTLDALIAPHVDHRIIATRLIDMALFRLFGWNPLLQMSLNVLFHTAALTALLRIVLRGQGAVWQIAVTALALLLFMVPFGYENILWGFQSQIYLSILFAILALWLAAGHPPLSRRWFAALFLGFCAFYSFASGIMVFFAIATIALLSMLTERQIRPRAIAAIVLAAAAFLLLYLSMPHVAPNDVLKAPSVSAWAQAMHRIMIWPVSEKSRTLGLLVWLPGLLFAVLLLWRKIPAGRLDLFLAGLLCWCLGIAAAIAYGRYQNPLASRYMDFWLIAVLVNGIVLMRLIQHNLHFRRFLLTSAVVWGIILTHAVFYAAGHGALTRLKAHIAFIRLGEIHVSRYLCTGDAAMLQHPLPYPDARMLQGFLDDPLIRRTLPQGFMRQLDCAPQ